MRLGYNTNGLAGMTVADAIAALARVGYRGVAITLDHGFMDPFSPGLGAIVAEAKTALTRQRMGAVIETGARFLLDTDVKHEPTLVSPSPEGRARRVDFLKRAIDIAAALNGECVSLWSGAVHDEANESEVFERLAAGLVEVLNYGVANDVIIAFEPEPDMFVDTMSKYSDLLTKLRKRNAPLSHLRLTMDVGHLHCQGEIPIAEYLRTWGDQIANIHIEDMRAGIHEHLMFGQGEIDFPPIFAALTDIGYTGLVNVELSRHSHEGLAAAQRSYDFLWPLCERFNCAVDASQPQ